MAKSKSVGESAKNFVNAARKGPVGPVAWAGPPRLRPVVRRVSVECVYSMMYDNGDYSL